MKEGKRAGRGDGATEMTRARIKMRKPNKTREKEGMVGRTSTRNEASCEVGTNHYRAISSKGKKMMNPMNHIC